VAALRQEGIIVAAHRQSRSGFLDHPRGRNDEPTWARQPEFDYFLPNSAGKKGSVARLTHARTHVAHLSY
jgi:hypothetical protein